MHTCLFILLFGLLTINAMAANSGWTRGDSYLLAGPAYAGVLDEHQRAFGVLELRPGFFYSRLGPWLSVHANEDAIYVATGLRYEWMVTDNIFLVPSFGVGIYSQDDAVELGHEIEFRSGIETGYRFENGHRISIGFGHVSNGGIGGINPGSELLALLYGIPLPWPTSTSP